MMMDRERPTVFGDGEQTRDFVYVDDVVDALYRAHDKAGGLIVNIGTGTETSVVRLYEAVARATGYTPAPRFAPARPGELQRSALDPGRAETHLGWKPWTTLDDGIARTLDWFGAQRKARQR
jgi:UDP-glucose 4-epimerase